MTRVAIQGEAGSFSHQAALQAVGPEVAIVPCRSFDALFEALSRGEVERGVVPVENTLAGAVQRSMDLLVLHRVHAVAETRVRVRLCLLARPGTKLEDVRTIASHPVALMQCRSFLAEHPLVTSREVYDTAGSVRDLMAGADYDGAVAASLAGELYGASLLAEGIEDDPGNFTRFLVVAREPGSHTEGATKTSVAFTLPHRPGSLARAIHTLVEAGMDLSRVESRPIVGHPWEYRFFMDMRGDDASAQRAAVERLRAVADDVRVIGQYAEAPADPAG